MEKVIVIRYGELHLKGKNRGYFEKLLVSDIRCKLKGTPHKLILGRGRYIISDFNEADESIIIEKLKKVFGLHSLSVAVKCNSELSKIEECVGQLFKEQHIKTGLTFKVESNRADKRFPLNSLDISRHIGGYLLDAYPDLRVDLTKPHITVNIDVRDEGYTFVFCGRTALANGMPLNSAGKGLVLLSGGIDSPVAGYLMAKRGLNISAIHFHSYPYTNEKARQKVVDLTAKLAEYTNKVTLINVKLTKIQEEIRRCCNAEYAVTLLRAIMMKVSCLVAKEHNCACVVNGESLGQVASQTLEGINITDSYADIPVLRPLISMDKQEIIEKAQQIGTFDISSLPFEDCCTIFLPAHPVIKPEKAKVIAELNKIPDLEFLISQAAEEKEISVIQNDA